VLRLPYLHEAMVHVWEGGMHTVFASAIGNGLLKVNKFRVDLIKSGGHCGRLKCHFTVYLEAIVWWNDS
jgi:hypothetical protein